MMLPGGQSLVAPYFVHFVRLILKTLMVAVVPSLYV